MPRRRVRHVQRATEPYSSRRTDATATFGGSPRPDVSGGRFSGELAAAGGHRLPEARRWGRRLIDTSAPRAATDDWPFLYLRTPFIAPYYLIGLAFALVFAIGGVLLGARATQTPIRRFSPHFFVLGIAFLLLKTRSIVTFSLLFGSTWLVNALVFFAVLASVLLAILVASRFTIRSTWWLYGALLGRLAAYVLPGLAPDRSRRGSATAA